MTKPDQVLLLTQQCRECEHHATAVLGQSEDTLMQLAGTAAFRAIQHLYAAHTPIAVFCGGGNNAGDGYVVARLAHEAQWPVYIYSYQRIDQLPPPAQRAAQAAVAAGVPINPPPTTLESAPIGLIVDALLGIGLKGPVRMPITQAIELINQSHKPVLALDVPSGLNADTGHVENIAVKAQHTISFIAPTVGLYTHQAADYCGQIITDSLQLDDHLATLTPAAMLMDPVSLKSHLVPRQKEAHKGLYGHVLIIGGGPGMPGAVTLAAHAALRVGAGRVTIAMHPDYAHQALSGLPEAMIQAVHNDTELAILLKTATVAVIGPGLGLDAWAQALYNTACNAEIPLVVDASALRLLSQKPQRRNHWVLTPHAGEAAALLTCSATAIQHDRLTAVKTLQRDYGGCIVLKGAGTLVADDHQPVSICQAGNPGMATAGMGDVLSGVIGGLLAQGLTPSEAGSLGVWLHATAGDQAAHMSGERGLIAGDLMPFLHQLVNPTP